MKIFLIITGWMLSVVSASGQRFPVDKKVLFLGNSITYEGTFISDIETYLTLKYHKEIQLTNMGLPSETVSGLSESGHADNRFPRPDLHERLSRVLKLVKPDLILASYGINDGIYMSFDTVRFSRYKEGVRWLHDAGVRSGATIIHLTPPFFDEKRGGHIGYENTMDKYAGWLLSMTDSSWKVIDIYNPMKEYLKAHREVDARFNLDGFALANDGVHPNGNSHWLMARSILMELGETAAADISSIESFAAGFANGTKVLEKVKEKQAIIKDAFLTAAGHKRPEINKGLPITEAERRKSAIDAEIQQLLK